jgi:hypothetical protein
MGNQQASIPLQEGDTISGTVSASGGSGNDIDFSATDPNGNTIFSKDRATYDTFSFKAPVSGTYILTFDNSFSVFSSKSISLSYDVQSPTPVPTAVPFLGGIGGENGNYDYTGLIVLIVFILAIVLVVAVVITRNRKTTSGSQYLPPPPP